MTLLSKTAVFMRSKYMLAVAMLSLVISITLLFTPGAEGLSGSQFQPGRIIDDAVFYNSSALSPGQIQDFLNSKVPACDTNGQEMYNSTQTRAQWAQANGRPLPPYTCLRNYSQNIPSITNGGSDLCKQSIFGGIKSAAVIIADVANACGINPQVLIVLLQKEQSLVTDDWPWPIQYRSATGYGCPDTAPCDSEYYGFFNQVYQAAKAYRRYEANPDSYNYKANRNNTILWHPNAGCGTSNVFIQNQATASLYIYTPYRPNQAALDNLYGSGDSCSSYGNRNFWRMFNDWFGATYAPQYSATAVSSWSSAPTGTMVAGDRVKVVFNVRNTGNQTWSKTNTKLGTAEPQDRVSVFRDSSWPSYNRATNLKENSVEPGGIGTFEFWYQAPTTLGLHTEKFSVVVEGGGWTPYSGLFLSTNVVRPNYSASVNSAGSYKDNPSSVGRSTSQMAPGERAYVIVRIKNTGNRIWKNSGVNVTRLATAEPNGRGSAFADGWLSHSRVSNMIESTVSPGQVATFKFWYRAPGIFGNHNEKFTLVHEGFAWTGYFGFNINTTVSAPSPVHQPISAASSISTATMRQGARSLVTFKVKNTGNLTWYKNNTRLGTAEPLGRISTFRYNTWPAANRTTSLLEDSVAPGEIGTFSFWYQAPNNNGVYEERFTPVVEGVAWSPYAGLYLKTKVIN